MRTYGAPESNGTEGMSVLALFVGVSVIAAGWAYAPDLLQILAVVIGLAIVAGSIYLMVRSRST